MWFWRHATTDLPFTVRNKTLNDSFSGRQGVCLRVHWLSVVVSDEAEKEGHEERGNGVRKVFMEVDVAQKLSLLYMFEFSDGLWDRRSDSSPEKKQVRWQGVAYGTAADFLFWIFYSSLGLGRPPGLS